MKPSKLFDTYNTSEWKRQFGDRYVKKRSDMCIVCGHNPREKSVGCFYWLKKVSNRHQYIYYEQRTTIA